MIVFHPWESRACFSFLWLFKLSTFLLIGCTFFHNKNANDGSNCFLFLKTTIPTASLKIKLRFWFLSQSLWAAGLRVSLFIFILLFHWSQAWWLVCAAGWEVGADGTVNLNGWMVWVSLPGLNVEAYRTSAEQFSKSKMLGLNTILLLYAKHLFFSLKKPLQD